MAKKGLIQKKPEGAPGYILGFVVLGLVLVIGSLAVVLGGTISGEGLSAANSGVGIGLLVLGMGLAAIGGIMSRKYVVPERKK